VFCPWPDVADVSSVFFPEKNEILFRDFPADGVGGEAAQRVVTLRVFVHLANVFGKLKRSDKN